MSSNGTRDENVEPPQAETTELAIFEAEANERIRKVWHDGRWFYSIIDIIALLTDSPRPRKYWADMKQRIQDEGFRELSAKCGQLKMRSPRDGKYYTTDAADRETVLRIVQSVPSPKAEPFKQWLARTGEERLQEEEQPSLAMERLRKIYLRKGYTDEWITERIKKVLIRNVITSEWLGRGAKSGRQVAKLTNELHQGTFDITPAQHLEIKDLPPTENLQDSMTIMELALSSLSEATAVTLHQKRDSHGFAALQRDAHEAGEVGGAARRDVEARIGESVVSPVNYKQLQQGRQRQLQPSLFEDIDGLDDE